MSAKQISAQEIAAAAEAATTTKLAAETAKKVWDAAPEDESLKGAYETAQKAADDAKRVVDDLSQEPSLTSEQIQKMKRRRAIIDSELRKAGVGDDKDDDDDIDPLEDDLDKPLTKRDLQRIEREKASHTTDQMAAAIEDPLLRKAVQDAVKDVVPSGNPAADFKKAVAIANIEKNSKVLEELGRRANPAQHISGAGSPAPKPDDTFVASAEEARFMKAFGLTKEQIIATRPKQQ